MNIIQNNNTTNLAAIFTQRGPLNWPIVLQYLLVHPQAIHHVEVLRIIRERLECYMCPLAIQIRLIDLFPKQLAFSLFLCATRFCEHSLELMNKIFKAIEIYTAEQMNYCIEKFHGDCTKPLTANTVIGEAMTLLFSFFDDFIATPESGNLAAIQLVRHRYPDAILYVDAHDFTPLHGVCCILNLDIMRYFIEWHLERDPLQRGGLYVMNDSGITSIDTLIDTSQDLTNELTWFQNRGLLSSRDVDEWLLIHRSAHSSSLPNIQFFLNLLPGGILSQDSDGNLPIHLHLGLRYRAGNVFSQSDFDITQLLIQYGIRNGGMNTIGGLFHPDPDDDNCCTIMALLKEAGKNNAERIWEIIDTCLNEVGNYERAPIVHAAIYNKDHISDEIFQNIITKYGTESRNDMGLLPLWYAVKVGRTWDNCVKHIVESNQMALYEEDQEDTGLPMLALFGASARADRGTVYELIKMNLNLFHI